jgi:hypothetical protein
MLNYHNVQFRANKINELICIWNNLHTTSFIPGKRIINDFNEFLDLDLTSKYFSNRNVADFSNYHCSESVRNYFYISIGEN